jgi:hypothetical protein
VIVAITPYASYLSGSLCCQQKPLIVVVDTTTPPTLPGIHKEAMMQNFVWDYQPRLKAAFRDLM